MCPYDKYFIIIRIIIKNKIFIINPFIAGGRLTVIFCPFKTLFIYNVELQESSLNVIFSCVQSITFIKFVKYPDIYKFHVIFGIFNI